MYTLTVILITTALFKALHSASKLYHVYKRKQMLMELIQQQLVNAAAEQLCNPHKSYTLEVKWDLWDSDKPEQILISATLNAE